MAHISDVKYVMPADSIIPHLPIPNQFGRMTKYNLNPKNVPDLGWKLSTCHQYFLYSIVLLNTLQLVTGATGL